MLNYKRFVTGETLSRTRRNRLIQLNRKERDTCASVAVRVEQEKARQARRHSHQLSRVLGCLSLPALLREYDERQTKNSADRRVRGTHGELRHVTAKQCSSSRGETEIVTHLSHAKAGRTLPYGVNDMTALGPYQRRLSLIHACRYDGDISSPDILFNERFYNPVQTLSKGKSTHTGLRDEFSYNKHAYTSRRPQTGAPKVVRSPDAGYSFHQRMLMWNNTGTLKPLQSGGSSASALPGLPGDHAGVERSTSLAYRKPRYTKFEIYLIPLF